jgi:hypothetical protein
MRFIGTFILTALLSRLSWAQAQVKLLPDARSPMVFGGGSREIGIRWHNPGNKIVSTEVHSRIFQTSSATAVLLSDTPWNEIEILPQQTVLESAILDFPAVKAETKFLVQWLENSNRVIGTTEVWIYPTNLLAELKPLIGEKTLGVLDPNGELMPMLKQNGVKFMNLGQTSLEDFSGQLAILGPFESKAQMPIDLDHQIKALAKRNVAVIWLLPPPDKQDKLLPSFYTVMEGTNIVVVAQADMVFKSKENPQSQLNLIHFCELALKPETFPLPHFTSQP